MIHPIDVVRFGVNYVPTRQWWYCWNDFSADAIAVDLDAIAALEADHIRVMLIWPSFQPNPGRVSGAHLERLSTLMTLAAERRLDVCVTVFVGWLSGYKFLPGYLLQEDFYTNLQMRAIQKYLLRELAGMLTHHDNFLGFDLGNELNCAWQTAELADGDAWMNDLFALCRELLPEGLHVNGVDHMPWFRSATFSPRSLAREPVPTLHTWPFFTGAIERDGGDPMGPRSEHLLASMAALARSYAGDAQRQVWVQEFGMSAEWAPVEDIPGWATRAIESGLRDGVAWFTWWASHDLDPGLTFKPLEYSLGLIGHDNRVKPQGEAFRELAAGYGGKPYDAAETAPLPEPPAHDIESTWAWLDNWMEDHR